MKFPANGLYAITQTENRTPETILTQTEAVLRGGAVVVQYRDKRSTQPDSLARSLLALCHDYHVPLIINDNIELAANLGADGVHLGKQDADIHHARQRLGPQAIIGISCYNDIDKAMTMEQLGANYVAFGRFFPSTSKPLASPAQLETLTTAKQTLSIPIVAIGGILPDNGDALLAAGADLLAVIGGLFNHHNPEIAAQRYQSLFT